MSLAHLTRAMTGIVSREATRYLQQKGRLFSAIVRPLLWLFVFGTGFKQALDLPIMEPYGSSISYDEYMLPGLVGMILLFNGMQSSLSTVYDRELGVMRLLLTAPLPRWYVLLGKLIAGTTVSTLQVYVFLGIAHLTGFTMPTVGWIYALPTSLISGSLLGAIGLVLAVRIKQLENFAGTMNFVIFPMFFFSTALYPLTTISENSEAMYLVAKYNPFSQVVEFVRFGLYGKLHLPAMLATLGYSIVFIALGIYGFSLRGSRSKPALPSSVGAP